jgi:hypothetical protein
MLGQLGWRLGDSQISATNGPAALSSAPEIDKKNDEKRR